MSSHWHKTKYSTSFFGLRLRIPSKIFLDKRSRFFLCVSNSKGRNHQVLDIPFHFWSWIAKVGIYSSSFLRSADRLQQKLKLKTKLSIFKHELEICSEKYVEFICPCFQKNLLKFTQIVVCATITWPTSHKRRL